ncbi:PREDICTED: zinc finger CONSTANS-LIKE 4 [Prunus dulcis]|uniref:PREDICTED: zinc finger CONSTANS-LIKE 4 n=1 Tax=Prunus dulcis TaxID=3755 RepID=A0A5E4EP72_PRUDU|nr:PREDICTED: zinc finger CONSTANS-LIKE 4 [Prunus dulcis]
MDDLNGKTVVSREVAKATSWLPQNPEVMENPALNTGKYLFPEMDHYLDLDYESVEGERDLNGPATRSEHSPTLKSLTDCICHGLPPIGSATSTP